jgi:hypothetical protein
VSTGALAPPIGDNAESELPLWRLYLLRAMYALIGLAQGARMVSVLWHHAPLDRGVMPSLLAAMCLLDLIGIKYPRRMLPLLLFELAWKATWFLGYGLPQWSSGQAPPTFGEDFPAITAGVIIMSLVIPWGYVWRQYVMAPGDRWRKAR